MPMTPADMDRQMDTHFGFEAADDVTGVLSTLADDVDHDIVGWPEGPSRGPEQARGFYEALFSDLADGQVTTIRRLYGDDFLVDESRWTGRAVGRPFGLEGRDRPLSFRLLHVVRFDDAERLAAEQVWVDLAAIQAQLPQR
ncbi:MAG: ester cyclase [Pseudomonadales bacterium]